MTTTEEELSFRIRNVHCETSLDVVDEYARSRYGRKLHQDLKAPLIRMFGICDNGEKCLANIHGFLPYFFLRSRTPFSSDLKKLVGKLVVKCANYLDIPLSRGYPLLADVIPVNLKDIYGFYPEKDYFIKVVFYDQILCHRIGLSLHKECGKNEMLQPYYSHIPYLLQFFMAFDIVGMGSVRFRQKGVRFRKISDDLLSTMPKAVKNNAKLSSTMANEFDVFVDDIVNEKTLSMKSEYQISGLETLWKEEEMRCRLRNEELKRPERLECGVPEIRTEREDNNLETFRKLLNEYLTGDPNISQINSDNRSDFSQTQATIDAVDKAELSFYVDKALEDERLRHQKEEQRDDDNIEGAELDEDETLINAEMLEMTQIPPAVDVITIDDDEDDNEKEKKDGEDDVIVIDDEDNEEGENSKKQPVIEHYTVEPKYSPVLLDFLNQESYEMPPVEEETMNYDDPPQSNESFWPDETYAPPGTYTDIRPVTPPSKISKVQNDAIEKFKNACSVKNLTVLSIEALFECNQESVKEKSDKSNEKKYFPDPQSDQCLGIFYVIYNDICNSFDRADIVGGCVTDKIKFCKKEFPMLECARNEGDIFRWLALILRKHNPDIIVGYDINRTSFNYLVQRAAVLGIRSFNEQVSRLLPRWDNDIRRSMDDIRGRIFLNVWKIVRHHQPMRHYRLSAVVHEILKQKFADMSQFFIEKLLVDNNSDLNSVVIKRFLKKANLNVQILAALDIFIRTSQMALVYGIQFTEVLTRGSQFRVESMLLRLANTHQYCPPSVTVEQRNTMPSPETIPLNMEPCSGIYYDPVVVLDFQSLYPSICIAYNYCFSTCLGTVAEWEKMLKNNATSLRLGALPYEPPMVEFVKNLQKQKLLTISPVGGIFVKKEVRKSEVALMLEELLETRQMVKTSMKKYKDEVLKRLLDARQLALKLIANVTYGYTAANFSGRMPCAELADAIVSKGREALERAIKMIENDVNDEYDGAVVIYGDTDSLFIRMPGKTKDEAFKIGRKIADDCTADNPYPLKLKFEKVMMPCCLLAKKRYVGMSFETEEVEEGVFDAKGIETVRRDSCEFVATSMKIILKKLFAKDITGVYKFLRDTAANLRHIPLHEFVISSDFRGEYSPNAVLPVKKIAEQLERISPFHIPRHGDRIEYIIAEPPVAYKKDATVYSCVFRLDRFIEIPELQIHYEYYMNRKLFPALARIFQLVPLRVYWFPDNTETCVGCGKRGDIWCPECIKDPQALQNIIKESIKCEKTFLDCSKICQNCINISSQYYRNIPCYNIDCKIWNQRYQIPRQKTKQIINGHYYRKTFAHISLPNVVE